MPLTLEQLPHAFESFLADWEKLKPCITNPENQTKNDDLKPLTIEEAADFLSISVNQMYNHVRKNAGLGYRPSKRWYFFKKDLIEFIQKEGISKLREKENEADSFIRKTRQKKPNALPKTLKQLHSHKPARAQKAEYA